MSRAFGDPSPRRFFGAGAALAGILHVRPVLLLFPAFLIPWFVGLARRRPDDERAPGAGTGLGAIGRGGDRGLRRTIGPCLAGFVLVAIPWSARSTLLTGRPVFILEGESSELFVGNRFDEQIAREKSPDLAAMSVRVILRAWKERFEILRAHPPAEAKAILAEKGLESLRRWVTEAPGNFARLLASKLHHLWLSPDPVAKDPSLQKLWKKAVHGPLLVLASIGLFLTRRKGPRLAPIHALFLYTTAFSLVGVGDFRYHYPLMPLVLTFACVTVDAFVHWISTNRSTRLQVSPRDGSSGLEARKTLESR
jgi:hypothetical protein